MPREDYNEIKTKFAQFVGVWKTKDIKKVSDIVCPEVDCRISAGFKSNMDYQKKEGVVRFIADYPETDLLQLSIYTYNCRLHKNEAQQIAHVVCESLNYVANQDEMDVFYYAILCANHWIKTDLGWKMDEMHMDIYPFYGNLRSQFEKVWYFGPKLVDDKNVARLPAIEGEYDLPWLRIPVSEDILTEEEKIKDCFAKMYFSADYIVNSFRVEACSSKLKTNSIHFGENEGVREMLSSLRYKRLKDRYWCHPYKFETIEINNENNYAKCVTHRVFGWKQRNHEYKWTKGNSEIEHTCVAGVTEFVKENGEWKIIDQTLKLGLYETGFYSKSYYGDLV